ncbi:hypothetical protein EF913_05370 [Streptomyces sp. WAC04189]|nr:hypothetical protein EF913_05370 [Streptomyces sp. WAC04189]RSS63105.1 hypothetical protein EF907_29365 [Streptomyces sp. WAC06273]
MRGGSQAPGKTSPIERRCSRSAGPLKSGPPRRGPGPGRGGAGGGGGACDQVSVPAGGRGAGAAAAERGR